MLPVSDGLFCRCTEGYSDVSHVMKYYTIGVDFPFNFNLIPLDSTTNASTLRQMINEWMNFMPAGSWPNWVLGNHDQHRVASRLGGRKYIDIANMLLLTLPGKRPAELGGPCLLEMEPPSSLTSF